MTLPTFFVCTMYSGEPDWEYCQAMIAAQKNVNVKHQLVGGLSEIDAHNVVYQAFNAADPMMIRAKIDADVVLQDEHMLERIALDLIMRPHAPGMMPFVHDHLTDTYIKAGVMFYTSKARFKIQTDPLKCDRNMLDKHVEDAILDWYCVGRHMYHCNDLTAFRYGYHRGLKTQTNIRDRVKKAYDKYHDRQRLLALMGFEAAQANQEYHDWINGIGEIPNYHNYDDAKFMQAFETCMNSI